MRILLIVFTFLYILIEVAFRAKLIDLVSSNPSLDDIENLEIIGRLISSLGLAVLLSSYIKFKEFKISYTIAKIVIVCSSFVGFYFAQEKALDLIVERIPVEVKRESILVSTYRENVLNDIDFDTSGQYKIYLASLPYVSMDNEKLLTYLSDKHMNVFAKNVQDDIFDFDYKKVDQMYFEDSSILNEMWMKYSRAVNIAKRESQRKYTDREKRHIYETHLFRAQQNFLKYRSIITGLFVITSSRDDRRKTYNSRIYEANSGYRTNSFNSPFAWDFDITFTSLDEYIDYWNHTYEYYAIKNVEARLKDAQYLHKKYYGVTKSYDNFFANYKEKVKNYGYEICNLVDVIPSNSGIDAEKAKNKGINIKTKINGDPIISYVDIDFDLNDKYLICDSRNIAHKMHLAFKSVADFINPYFFGFNKDVYSERQFYRTEIGQLMLKDTYEDSGYTMPNGYNPLDKAEFAREFKRYMRSKNQNKLDNEIARLVDMNTSDYVRKYGHVPKDVDEIGFYNISGVSLFIQNKLPFFSKTNGKWDVHYKGLGLNKYFETRSNEILTKYFKKRMEFDGNLKLSHFRGEKEEIELLDSFAKLTILPVFIMVVSTIFILLNIANLIILVFNIERFSFKFGVYLIFFLVMIGMINYENLEDLNETEKLVITYSSENTMRMFYFMKNSESLLGNFNILEDSFEKMFNEM